MSSDSDRPSTSGGDRSSPEPLETPGTSKPTGGGRPPRDSVLRAARERLRVERRILGDERCAFRAFADRLLDLEGPAPPATIESHYRGTVMATPHYWSEYGDTYAESVAAEFGAIVAADCLATEQLDPPTVTAIRKAAERSCRRRDVVVDRIDAERHSLRRAGEELAEIGRALAELDGDPAGSARLRLAMLRERCDDVARRRREHLRDDPLDDGVWLDLELPDHEVVGSTDGDGVTVDSVGVGTEMGDGAAADERDSETMDEGGGVATDDGDCAVTGDHTDPCLQSLCYRELDTDRPVLSAVQTLRSSIEQRRTEVVGRQTSGR